MERGARHHLLLLPADALVYVRVHAALAAAVTWCRSSAGTVWLAALVTYALVCACTCCCGCRSDLVPLIRWNEAHGIRLFWLSSCILPWMTSYEPEELPDWPEIQVVRLMLCLWDVVMFASSQGCGGLCELVRQTDASCSEVDICLQLCQCFTCLGVRWCASWAACAQQCHGLNQFVFSCCLMLRIAACCYRLLLLLPPGAACCG
jgi:hypothetical protein